MQTRRASSAVVFWKTLSSRTGIRRTTLSRKYAAFSGRQTHLLSNARQQGDFFYVIHMKVRQILREDPSYRRSPELAPSHLTPPYGMLRDTRAYASRACYPLFNPFPSRRVPDGASFVHHSVLSGIPDLQCIPTLPRVHIILT